MKAAASRDLRWCRRFAAASPAYELYATRGMRARAWMRTLLRMLLAAVTFGRRAA